MAAVGFYFGRLGGLFGLILGGFLTGLPIDKYLDENHRQLVKIAGEEKG